MAIRIIFGQIGQQMEQVLTRKTRNVLRGLTKLLGEVLENSMRIKILLVCGFWTIGIAISSCYRNKPQVVESFERRITRFESGSALPLSLYASDLGRSELFLRKLIALNTNSKRVAYHSSTGYLAQLMKRAYSIDGREYDVLMLTNIKNSQVLSNGQFEIIAYPIIFTDGAVVRSIQVGSDNSIRLSCATSGDRIISLNAFDLAKPRKIYEKEFDFHSHPSKASKE